MRSTAFDELGGPSEPSDILALPDSEAPPNHLKGQLKGRELRGQLKKGRELKGELKGRQLMDQKSAGPGAREEGGVVW